MAQIVVGARDMDIPLLVDEDEFDGDAGGIVPAAAPLPLLLLVGSTANVLTQWGNFAFTCW